MRYDLSETIEAHFVEDLTDVIVDRPEGLFLVDTRGMSGAGFADFMRKLYKKGVKTAKDTVGFVKKHGAKAVKTYDDVSKVYDKAKPMIGEAYGAYNDNVKQYVPDKISNFTDKAGQYASTADQKLTGYRGQIDTGIDTFNDYTGKAEELVDKAESYIPQEGKGHPAQQLRKRLLRLEGKGIHTGGSKGRGLNTGGSLYTTGSKKTGITKRAVQHLQQGTGMTNAHAADLFKRCQCGSGIGSTPAKQYLRPLRKLARRTPKTHAILKDLEKVLDAKFKQTGKGKGKGKKVKVKDILNTVEHVGKIVAPFLPLLL